MVRLSRRLAVPRPMIMPVGRALSCMALFLALVFAGAGVAQPRPDEIDGVVGNEMQRQRIPGLSLVVIKDKKIVKAEGYGVADLSRRTPASPETVYKIASVSKQFIAAGIMVLAQEGKLGVDDPISRYLEGTPDTWQAITIRHLLTHTAGLVREAPGFAPHKIQSDADLIRTAYPLPLRFAPGEKWEYSNVGYFALAEVIRKVSGRPWGDYLTEKVFRPSGMNTTFTTNTKETVPNRAIGYTDNDKLVPAGDWTALRPSGAFLSTIMDLAKWDAVLNTDKILTESTRRQMWTAVTLNNGTSGTYGFGWQIDSFKGHRRVYHFGGMTGFRSAFARFVDDRLTIILLMNLDDVDPGAILNRVAQLYFDSR